MTGRPCAEKCFRKSGSVILGGRFLTKSLDDLAVAGSGFVWFVDMALLEGGRREADGNGGGCDKDELHQVEARERAEAEAGNWHAAFSALLLAELFFFCMVPPAEKAYLIRPSSLTALPP